MGLEVIIQLDEYNRINSELDRHKKEMDAIIQNREVLIVGDSKLITEKGLMDESLRESVNAIKEELQENIEELAKCKEQLGELQLELSKNQRAIEAQKQKESGYLDQVLGLQHALNLVQESEKAAEDAASEYLHKVESFNRMSLLKRILTVHV